MASKTDSKEKEATPQKILKSSEVVVNFEKKNNVFSRIIHRKKDKGPVWEVKFPTSGMRRANYICTQKYSVITFLPLNLYYQVILSRFILSSLTKNYYIFSFSDFPTFTF
jgi:hypothetical protein